MYQLGAICQQAVILRLLKLDSNTRKFSRILISKVVCHIRNNPDVQKTPSLAHATLST